MGKKSSRILGLLAAVLVVCGAVNTTLYVKANDEMKTLEKQYNEIKTKDEKLKKDNEVLKVQIVDEKKKYDQKVLQMKRDKEKIIYLTFDDGPSDNTTQILDILKKYEVKGTFFVINNKDDAKYKAILDSRNAIALHTYAHDYDMYKSSEAFMNDLHKIHKRVLEATGQDIKSFRFAGGSSNSFVSDKVFTEILHETKKEGYDYFDWNCSSSDASGVEVSKKKILKSSTSCDGIKHINLLMHDAAAKKTTVEALPGIIEHYKKKGYVFETINNQAIEVKHRLK